MSRLAKVFASTRMFEEVSKLQAYLLFALLFWVAFGCFPALCMDFELIGRSTFENYKLDGTKYKIFSGSFSVQKNGDKWVIVYLNDGTKTTEHVMFDGEDVYTLTGNIVVDKNFPNRSSIPETDHVYSNGFAYPIKRPE